MLDKASTPSTDMTHFITQKTQYKIFMLGQRHISLEMASRAKFIPLTYSSNIDQVSLGLKIHVEQEEKAVLIINDAKGSVIFSNPEFLELKEYCLRNGIPTILVSKGFRLKVFNEALAHQLDDIYFEPLNHEDLFYRVNFLFNFRKSKIEYLQQSTQTQHEIYISPLKRAMDIIISGGVLLALSPLLLIIVGLIYLESPGPVFYASKRVGAGYRIFDFYKLRSMRIGADKLLSSIKGQNQYAQRAEQETFQHCDGCLEGHGTCSSYLFSNEGKTLCEKHIQFLKEQEKLNTFIKIEQDPRITKVGQFIRNTSIDELPQLINVLKGDMSIVGNRPLPLYEAERLTTDSSSKRFLAPAGITGLWQVSKRGKGGELSPEERIALDNEYADKHNVWYDIKLILRTIPALFQSENV